MRKVKTTGTPTVTKIDTTVVLKEMLEPCTLTFPNEDMNRLVEYINKLVEKINKC